MKLNDKEIAPYASKHITDGFIGLSPSARARVGLGTGTVVDLVFTKAGDVKSFKIMNAPLSDILMVGEETGYHHKNIAFVSPSDFELLDSIFKKEETQEDPSWVPAQKIPYTMTDKGVIIICVSELMPSDVFPDYTVRMDDRTRKELGQTWNSPWVISGRRYTVKPALAGDLESIESYHLPARVVFMCKNSVPDNCEVFVIPEVKTIPTKTYEINSEQLRWVTSILGTDLIRDIEVRETPTRGGKTISTIQYKTWAAGVVTGNDSKSNLREALKLLRIDLIKLRNKMNETIDRIHPD